MNKLWIEHSHDDSTLHREEYNIKRLSRFEYLDMVGLLETSWMIYEHTGRRKYGYPG